MASSSAALEMCNRATIKQGQQLLLLYVHDPLTTTVANNATKDSLSSASAAASLNVPDDRESIGDDSMRLKMMGSFGSNGDEAEGMICNSSRSHDGPIDHHATNVGRKTTNTSAFTTLRNFYVMSILFSTVPAAALACLSLATARLGSIGAWQSGILYLSYCSSALLGATYVVKRLGSRNALVLGMSLYCLYVTCFWLAALDAFMVEEQQRAWALTVGAVLGGWGAGIMWTAQGTYFAQAAQAYALEMTPADMDAGAATSAAVVASSSANSKLAGIFAFCLLVQETTFDLLSTLLIRVFGISWTFIFGLYTCLAVSATILLRIMIKEYPQQQQHDDDGDDVLIAGSSARWNDVFYKATCALNLLVNDSKMKYMIGFNAAFGFCGAFLNSFVSGQVVPVALRDANASYVGLFVAVHGTVAALSSIVFAHYLSPKVGNGPILSLGAVAFAAVAFPFLIQPNLEQWTWSLLLLIYAAEGVGRATFESTLKAVFADFFYYEKEGAFANVILQNGVASAIAYVMSFRLTCNDNTGTSSTGTNGYCIEYRDGSHHDIFAFGMMVIVASIIAITGYWRALELFHSEHVVRRYDQTPLRQRTRPLYSLANADNDNALVDREASPEIEENDSSHLPPIT